MYRSAFRVLKKPLESVLCFPYLREQYTRIPGGLDHCDFIRQTLRLFNISADVPPGELERIPASGPVIVVANHPFGALEGLLLAELLGRVRPDFKLLANYMLGRIPELRPLLFLVDPFGTEKSGAFNMGPLRECIQWIRKGGGAAVFPAGEVSHLNFRRGGVTDPPWSETAARIAMRTGAPVVPMYFDGRNGAVFQLAGMVHPGLRTLLLPQATLKKRNQIIPVRVGTPIPPGKLAAFEDHRERTAYLRLRTYMLAPKRRGGSRTETTQAPGFPAIRREKSIAGPVPESQLMEDIRRLERGNAILVENGMYRVFLAESGDIPAVLSEIGRLRETAFRAVDEGTGKPLDIDGFDRHYLHLFLWRRDRREIAGAYRIGEIGHILRTRGKRGLYTNTLFRYHPAFFEHLPPALELGRSFVRPEYQKSHSALTLLWKGIARFLCLNPNYRCLIGPVSVSRRYSRQSRAVLTEFLKGACLDAGLARYVKPVHPPRQPVFQPREYRSAGEVIHRMDDLSELISEIESGEMGVPVLLKLYLQLKARALGFNIDPCFNNALDCLMMVDAARIERRLLAFYMGGGEADAYLAHHTAAAADAV